MPSCILVHFLYFSTFKAAQEGCALPWCRQIEGAAPAPSDSLFVVQTKLEVCVLAAKHNLFVVQGGSCFVFAYAEISDYQQKSPAEKWPPSEIPGKK